MSNLRASAAFIIGLLVFGTVYFRFDYIYDVFSNPVGIVKSKSDPPQQLSLTS